MNTNGGVPPFKGVDYYGLLNISKDVCHLFIVAYSKKIAFSIFILLTHHVKASTEEIRASYKKLALTYHSIIYYHYSHKIEKNNN